VSEEIVYIEQRWDITYRHSAGKTASHFFQQLKQGTLLGKRCPGCRRVLMPPRAFCDRCHKATAEWVEVGREGVIEASTIVFQQFKGLPEPPYALAYVRLNGADTALCNYVRGLDLSDARRAAERLKIGTRVKVVFRDMPEGRMSDFWYELSE